MKKKIAVLMFVLVLVGCISVFNGTGVKADTSISEMVDSVIESDKELLGNLSPKLQKLYEKAIDLFKSVGTMAKDVKKVVSMYNALDETSETYAADLQAFFEAYNKLSAWKRKVVDGCTGLLSAKDTLLGNLRHIVLIDSYSEKDITIDAPEKITELLSENDTIAYVTDSGKIMAAGTGMTKITATLENGEVETYRIFVKKPILATKVKVKTGATAKITIPTDVQAVNLKVSSKKKISASITDGTIVVTGKSKGKAYVYLGTTTGKTLKYKISIS